MSENNELKHMGYLRVMKARSITFKYGPKVSRFQEVYLVTWYIKRYSQVCSYSFIRQKSKVEQITAKKYVNIV